MTQIEIRHKWYTIPTEWNELTAEQLLQVMDTIYLKNYELEKGKLKLLKVLTGITYYSWVKLKVTDIDDYLYLTEFLLKETIALTKQLIPQYENYYGPSDEAGNMKAGEMVFANHYHDSWWNEKSNIKILDDLVAVLYRPGKKVNSDGDEYDHISNPDGDHREDFNENISSWNADHFICNWPLGIKLAIATWYTGCRQLLAEENKDVFGGPGEPAKYGLISILRTIAEKGTYGTFDDVVKMPVSMMMIELNETVAEGKKIEEQLQKQSNG